ncbi:hypothetical protein [Sphingomonas sp. 35-24ZXX]|jgi:hypothetical protein|uniref:hypothetical protein n=1 Tax=Sphingomonas sp. 35-24ZXX TaxID=1545915 RepID=UPI0006908878|nr:hypothetical protein [Sphingomonas sp. 35-24ZXX]
MNDELQPSGAKQKSGELPPIALIGWTHRELPNGIDLRIECARSRIALENDVIEHRDIVMTRNQALLLARYLLKVTGQSLPIEAKPTLWSKVKSVWGGSGGHDRRASRNLAS